MVHSLRLSLGMKTNYFKAICVLALTTLISACGSSHYGDDGGETVKALTAKTLHYYRGGGLIGGWTHDLNMDFTQTDAIHVTAKTQDPLCFKSGTLTLQQSTDLNNLIRSLVLKRATQPAALDVGSEYVEMVATDGSTIKINLFEISTEKNDIYAENGDELSDFLQDIDAGLATACQ